MAKSDRLFLLLAEFRRHKSVVTARELAARLEVSERTIYRDIETLRAGGAIIDGEVGVGYQLIEDSALPPQMFSRLEIEALALALSDMRYSGDLALKNAAGTAFDKIVATLPNSKQREAIHTAYLSFRFMSRDPVPAHMPIVREAIWQERAIATDYEDNNGAQTHRKLWPLAVAYMDRELMLGAYCTLREDFRSFHLKRMENVKLLDESFRPRRVALLRAFGEAHSR